MSRLVSALGVAAILLFALNGSMFHARFDLTRGRVYSLSEVTQAIVDDLPGPVLLTYYRSEILRNVVPGVAEAEDFLRSFSSAAGSKVELRLADTSGVPFAESVSDMGLTPLRLELPREDADQTAYAGLVLRLYDRTVSVPRVLGIDRLEYELALGLRRLSAGTLPTLVVLEADRRLRFDRDFRLLESRLQDRYRIVVATEPGDIAPEADSFLVLGAYLDHTMVAVVEQRLAEGAGALFAFDGADPEDERRRATPGATQQLLSRYGIEVEPSIVLDSSNVLVPFNRFDDAGGRVVYEPYPYWIEVQEQNVDREHPVTAGFAGLTLFWASPLRIVPPRPADGPPGDHTIIAATTDDSWTVVPPVSMESEAARRSQELSTSLAVRRPLVISYGPTKTSNGGTPTEAPTAGVSSRPASGPRMMVVGDWEFASDLVSAADAGHNLEFVLNALEWVSGDDDLLSIRMRGARDQRLSRTDGTAGRRRRNLVEILGMLVIPAVWFVVGAVVVLRRRRRGESVE